MDRPSLLDLILQCAFGRITKSKGNSVMEPKFKKTKRKGDLRHPWEYQGWLIHSSKPGMYNMVNWFANKNDHKTIVASSLKSLCLEIDKGVNNGS